MIQENRKFLGLFSIHTRRSRRRLVLGYTLLLLTLGAVAIARPKSFLPVMVCQCFTLGGLLGGIASGGPVKRYESGNRFADDPSLTTAAYPVQTLNLSGHLLNPDQMLDEREHAERDRAHYMAYKILRFVVPAFCLGFAYLLWILPAVFVHAAPGILWLLVLVVLSLPQIVLLWAEPDPMPDGPVLLQSRSA
jgi:predicted MFS family arabinose efflux permease